MTALPYEQIVNIHEPDLAKLILIEVDLHLEQVIPVRILEIEPDYVAHLQAKLQRLCLS